MWVVNVFTSRERARAKWMFVENEWSIEHTIADWENQQGLLADIVGWQYPSVPRSQ